MVHIHQVEHTCQTGGLAEAIGTVSERDGALEWVNRAGSKRIRFCDQCGERLPTDLATVWAQLEAVYRHNLASAAA